MANNWKMLASQIASDADTTFVVIASADGSSHVEFGNCDDADFSHLIDVHCATPDAVRRSYESLNGMLLPQSTSQGDKFIFRHRPSDGVLVLTARLLPRSLASDGDSYAKLIYETGRLLDQTVVNAFRRFSVR